MLCEYSILIEVFISGRFFDAIDLISLSDASTLNIPIKIK